MRMNTRVTRAMFPMAGAYTALGLHVHVYWIVAALWAVMFAAGEAANFLGEGKAVKAALKKPLEEAEPVPDNLSKYVPAGQAELSKELLRTLKAEKAATANGHWYTWQMSEPWAAEVRRLRSNHPDGQLLWARDNDALLGYPVFTGNEFGVPRLVKAEKPPQKRAVPPENRAVKMLDDAIAAALTSRDKPPMATAPSVSGAPGVPEVLPADQRLAYRRFTQLEADLKAVNRKLKELYQRYDAVKAFAEGNARLNDAILKTYGVPPDAHHCNGKYYQDVRYCPKHGK